MLIRFNPSLIIAGTDEAGRGCLAGPVTAAAVILDGHTEYKQLNDSKKLSVRLRNMIRPMIEQHAICYSVAHLHPQTIDEINILNASIEAMHHALSDLKQNPEKILVDGTRFKPYGAVPYECVIKGDGKYLSIAAASVLAKTYRDAYMEKIHEEYPMYNWKKNKGYPTAEHREAIKKYGISPYHRKSFQLLPKQLKLEL